MKDYTKLIAEARNFTDGPAPERHDIVPATVFVDLVSRLLDALDDVSAVRNSDVSGARE